jgi:hypothetical protein
MMIPLRHREVGLYFARNGYFTLPLFASLVYCPGLFVLIGSLLGRRIRINPELLSLQWISTVVVAALLAYHLKRAFAHPRARVLPGFAGPHLLWIAGIGVTAGAVLPAFSLLSIGRNGTFLGLFSILLASFAAVAWLCHLVPRSVFLLWISGFYLFRIEAMARPLQRWLDGEAPLHAMSLTAFSGLALLLLGVEREEMMVFGHLFRHPIRAPAEKEQS